MDSQDFYPENHLESTVFEQETIKIERRSRSRNRAHKSTKHKEAEKSRHHQTHTKDNGLEVNSLFYPDDVMAEKNALREINMADQGKLSLALSENPTQRIRRISVMPLGPLQENEPGDTPVEYFSELAELDNGGLREVPPRNGSKNRSGSKGKRHKDICADSIDITIIDSCADSDTLDRMAANQDKNVTMERVDDEKRNSLRRWEQESRAEVYMVSPRPVPSADRTYCPPIDIQETEASRPRKSYVKGKRTREQKKRRDGERREKNEITTASAEQVTDCTKLDEPTSLDGEEVGVSQSQNDETVLKARKSSRSHKTEIENGIQGKGPKRRKAKKGRKPKKKQAGVDVYGIEGIDYQVINGVIIPKLDFSSFVSPNTSPRPPLSLISFTSTEPDEAEPQQMTFGKKLKQKWRSFTRVLITCCCITYEED